MGVIEEKEQATLTGKVMISCNVPVDFAKRKRQHGLTWEGIIKLGLESQEKDETEDVQHLYTNIERLRNRLIESESRIADLERQKNDKILQQLP